MPRDVVPRVQASLGGAETVDTDPLWCLALARRQGILVLFPFLVHVFDGMFSPSCRRNSYCLQQFAELNFVPGVVFASALADVAMLQALRGGGLVLRVSAES